MKLAVVSQKKINRIYENKIFNNWDRIYCSSLMVCNYYMYLTCLFACVEICSLDQESKH